MILFWIIVTAVMRPQGSLFSGTQRSPYYAIWFILPFRMLMSLAFGYLIVTINDVGQKSFAITSHEFEQDKIMQEKNPVESEIGTSVK